MFWTRSAADAHSGKRSRISPWAARASKNEAEIEAAEKALQQVKESVMAAWNAYAKMATEVDAFQTERAVDKALGVAPQQPR